MTPCLVHKEKSNLITYHSCVCAGGRVPFFFWEFFCLIDKNNIFHQFTICFMSMLPLSKTTNTKKEMRKLARSERFAGTNAKMHEKGT